MTYDPTLYGRDEEEEFGDSGAYSESLEEDFEEEEEEEAGVPEPAAVTPPPPPPAPWSQRLGNTDETPSLGPVGCRR